MSKESKLSVAIFCLSISLIISAFIIANGLKTNGDYISTGLYNVANGTDISVNMPNDYENTSSTVHKRSTYDLSAAALYLGITEESLLDLINAEHSGIPYIKIDDSYTFSKAALDKWLETARVEINKN